MSRMTHGEAPSLESLREAQTRISSIDMDTRLPFPLATVRQSWPFGYLFFDLQMNPANLLPTSDETVLYLRRLGQTMIETDLSKHGHNVPVPTVYTFFGQFVDHDITLETVSNDIRCISEKCRPKPISLFEVALKIQNFQSPNLDLATVYGGNAQRDGEKMLIDEVVITRVPCNMKDPFHDLPRGPKSSDFRKDRVALIGDTRNDENLIIAQLHVAFLRAHNTLVEKGHCYEEARKLIRQHYQWVVLDDFLYRVADPYIVDSVREKGPRFFTPPADSFFTPLEFTVAAFRFGHSKVRPGYVQFNEINLVGDFIRLFHFTLSSGAMGGFPNLPSDWVIDWTKFVNPTADNHNSRAIDTLLADPLSSLKQEGGEPLEHEVNLAIRNLLRGYILRMPTGQAVADAMGFTPLTDKEIADIPSVVQRPEQLEVLRDSGFLTRTPLWFYILAEAAHYDCRVEHRCLKGQHLGPVGSTIVAEVLYGILQNTTDSILSDPAWRPTIGEKPGEFKLPDLLKLAGVL
jgi:hypothetical protein